MKTMMKAHKVIVVAALVLGLASCSSDKTTSPTTSAALNLDNTSAEEFSLMAVGVFNEYVTRAPDLAAGDFKKLQPGTFALNKAGEDTVTWDPDQMAWELDFVADVEDLELPNFGRINFSLWLQFRNGLVPQQYEIGATEVELRGDYALVSHTVEEGVVIDLDMRLHSDMIVTYLEENMSYGIVGSGEMTAEVISSSLDASESGSVSVSWTMNLTTSELGCPSGTATVTAQEWQMAAVYDGLGGLAWTLTGPNYIGEGTEVLDCFVIEVGQN